MSRVVGQEDVLLQIYAFLDSCGYSRSILALQAESGVPYNVIHSVSLAPTSRRSEDAPRTAEALEKAVLEGNWFDVLSRFVDGLLLPQDVKEAVYETIFEELLELHGLREAARALLSHSPVFKEMRVHSPARFARLEGILQHFNAAAVEERALVRAATPAEVQTKRETILRQLLAHIHFSAEPYDGVLPAALAARRAHNTNGRAVDSATPRAAKRPRENDALYQTPTRQDALHLVGHPVDAPSHVQTKISFNDDSLISCCAALTSRSPGGSAVALLGRANGAVDFVDPSTGQANGASVGHTAGVLSLASDCPEGQPAWVGAGYRDGTVKVYNGDTRKLVRRFPSVHSLGVTCLAFLGSTTEDGLTGHHALLVSGSFDTTIHVLSLSQGVSLFHLRGAHHDAFVHALCPLRTPACLMEQGEHMLLSAGNDGMLCGWKLQRHHHAGAATTRCDRVCDGTVSLHALYKPAGDAIPTVLLPVDRSDTETETATTSEVVILTRSKTALVVSIQCADDDVHPMTYSVLCAVDTQRAVRFGACVVSATPTHGLPTLSLYLTDEDGTILLFNTEMLWRDSEKWAQQGSGVRRVTHSTGQSAAVAVDVGESVTDLHLACFPPSPECERVRLVACGPSLHAAYLLD